MNAYEQGIERSKDDVSVVQRPKWGCGFHKWRSEKTEADCFYDGSLLCYVGGNGSLSLGSCSGESKSMLIQHCLQNCSNTSMSQKSV